MANGNGKPNIMRYWQPVLFIVTIVFYTGSIYNMSKVNADEIDDIQDHCFRLNEATSKIPVIERDISYIKEKQNALSVSQDRMLQEQRIVLKSLIRIEAKI